MIWAAREGHENIAAMLLANGADVEAKDVVSGESIVYLLYDYMH